MRGGREAVCACARAYVRELSPRRPSMPMTSSCQVRISPVTSRMSSPHPTACSNARRRQRTRQRLPAATGASGDVAAAQVCTRVCVGIAGDWCGAHQRDDRDEDAEVEREAAAGLVRDRPGVLPHGGAGLDGRGRGPVGRRGRSPQLHQRQPPRLGLQHGQLQLCSSLPPSCRLDLWDLF